MSSREVRNLGRGLERMFQNQVTDFNSKFDRSFKGPIELTVEVCNLILKHPFYFYDGNPTFLMGFDLITRAALTIDAESRCVWSKHTLRFHIKQDLANACAKPTIQVNADPFLETVPPCCCLPPSEHADHENMSEDLCLDKELIPLSTASCTPSSLRIPQRIDFRILADLRLMTSLEYRTPPNLALASKPESRHRSRFALESTDFSHEQIEALNTESLNTDNSSEITRTSEQSSEIENTLNPCTTVFVPEHTALVDNSTNPNENLNSGTQTLIESPLENAVTTCDSDPPSSVHVVKSLFEPLNLDDDVTLLKTKFHPGGNSSESVVMEINEESGLPEHVHTLFTQTFEQSDFPIEAADGLKQLFDHRDTFASSSSDLGYCAILKHDIDTGDKRPMRQSPRKPPLAARDAED